MTSVGRAVLVSSVAGLAVVGAYHVLVASRGDRAPAAPRPPTPIEEIRGELETWRREAFGRGVAVAETVDATARLDALERRLAELERSAGRPRAPVAGPPSAPPPLPLPKASADLPSEAQLQELERLLRAVSERDALARESTAMWGLVRSTGEELLPQQERSAVARLLGFRVKVRGLYAEIPDQSKMTPADILAFEGKIKDLRALLEDELSSIVGARAAARIAEAAPPARRSTEPDSTPPTK